MRVSASHESQSWQGNENWRLETPAFRFIPEGYFKYRWRLLSIFHKKLFRICGVEINIGGLLFFILVFSSLFIIEYMVLGKEKHLHKNTGKIAFVNLCLVFSFSSRNSIWAMLAGLSYHRAIFWHKAFALSLIACSFVHGFTTMWKSPKGLLLFANIITILVFSLWFFRNRCFYYFYVLHIALVMALIYSTYNHKRHINLYACLFWIIDLLFRMAFSLYYYRKAKKFMIRLSDSKNFIELLFKSSLIRHQPGQYFFITIPRISLIEPHPFTISSSEEADEVKFYIRKRGDWTQELAKLAEGKNEVAVFLDGPYGSPTINMSDSSIKHFILIAGGIGISYIKPMAESLMLQALKGRHINSLTLLWAVREKELIDFVHFPEELIESVNKDFGLQTESPNPVSSSSLIQIEIYYQNDQNDDPVTSAGKRKWIISERLILDKFFKKFAQGVSTCGNQGVKVLCCGPERMSAECFDLCKYYKYDMHVEHFKL